MAQFKTAVITQKGVALMGKILSGGAKLQFSKICTTDTTYKDNQLSGLTALTAIKQEALIAEVTKQNDTTVTVSTSFSNKELKQGYYVRTLGLYATDPADGDILYSVCIVDEDVAPPDYMPPYNNVGVSSLEINMVTTVGNAANVTVEVNPAAQATVSQIKNLQDQIDDLKGYTGYMDEEIYGVEVDFKNKKNTRLAGAAGQREGVFFDALKPWGGRRRCILSDDGYRLGYYGDPQYTETGNLIQAVNVETAPAHDSVPATTKTFPIGTAVQVMVEQPKFWVKVVPLVLEKNPSGRGMCMRKARFYVATAPKPGFILPDVFIAANGREQDYIYLSAYEGSLYDVSETAYLLEDEGVGDFTAKTGDKLCSIAGAKPCSGKTNVFTRNASRIAADNRNEGVDSDNTAGGRGWRQHNIFAMSVSQILSLVEYATFDVQTAIGKGVSTFTDDGASNMAIKTGETASLGNKSGNGGENDGKHSVSYRGEENLWGNIWTWLDGINVECKGIENVYLNPDSAKMKDDTSENGYKDAGFTAAKANGYVSAFGWNEAFPYILIPAEVQGQSNAPVGNYHWQNYTYNGFMVAQLGGGWNSGAYCGWYLTLDITSSHRHRDIGGRLLYVPQADNPKYLMPVKAA